MENLSPHRSTSSGYLAISITPFQIFMLTISLSVLLVLLHLCGLYLTYVLDHDYVYGFVPLFNLDREGNVPTLFSSAMLIVNGLLCCIAANINRRDRFRWWFMALVFVVLGVDETSGFHEPLFFVLRGNRSENTEGLATALEGITYVTLLPVIAVAFTVLLIWYWPLARRAGKHVVSVALASAAAYLGGVLVIDNMLVVEAEFLYSLSERLTLSTLEESLELLGVCLFMYAVCKYISLGGGAQLVIAADAE